MSAISVFEYNGYDISFDWSNAADDQFINLTHMAKAHGKFVGHWLENQATKELLDVWKVNYRNSDSLSKPIFSVEGRNGGTWAHRKIAIQFAQWCSPQFALWVSDRIEELMTTGTTSLESDPVVPEVGNIIATLHDRSYYIAKLHKQFELMDSYISTGVSHEMLNALTASIAETRRSMNDLAPLKKSKPVSDVSDVSHGADDQDDFSLGDMTEEKRFWMSKLVRKFRKCRPGYVFRANDKYFCISHTPSLFDAFGLNDGRRTICKDGFDLIAREMEAQGLITYDRVKMTVRVVR